MKTSWIGALCVPSLFAVSCVERGGEVDASALQSPTQTYAALLDAMKSGEAVRLKPLCTARGLKSLVAYTSDSQKMISLGQMLDRAGRENPVGWEMDTRGTAAVTIHTRAPVRVDFIEVDGAWKVDQFSMGSGN